MTAKKNLMRQYNDTDIKTQKKDNYLYPGAVLKAGRWVCEESPEERETSCKSEITIKKSKEIDSLIKAKVKGEGNLILAFLRSFW